MAHRRKEVFMPDPRHDGGAKQSQVLVVDDHPIVRRGLIQILSDAQDLAVCGEAGNADEALQSLESARPDIVLADISLGDTNGLDLTRTIGRRDPQVPVLVISIHDETIYAKLALKAGAKGYVMKQEAPETMLTAIRTVLAGGFYLSARMMPLLTEVA
jgi:DNA-binding NarL/FixJ family response regulator